MVPYPCPCPGLIDHYTVSFPPARRSGPLEEQHAPCCGGPGGSMSFWLPFKVPWPLDPGVRREDDERALRQIGPSALFRFLRALPSFPPRKRGPRSRDGAAVTERTSAQRVFRRHAACALVNIRHPLCGPGPGGSMPSWLPARARWSLDPAVRPSDPERALRQIGPSALFRFLRALPSFPPQKRGPRNRGGATPTGRTSAQRIFRQHDAWVLVKRRHLLCCGGHGGSMPSWLPSRARWSLGPGVCRENEG